MFISLSEYFPAGVRESATQSLDFASFSLPQGKLYSKCTNFHPSDEAEKQRSVVAEKRREPVALRTCTVHVNVPSHS